jgi:heterodisulfide reductase subunit C
MSVKLKNSEIVGDFSTHVNQVSGARLLSCLQCKKCSAGCPVAGRADIKAHEIVRLVQLGQEREVLSSKMIWECTSCQTCATRCPQKVSVAALIDTLRCVSREEQRVNGETTLPTFTDAFLDSVRKHGRVFEVGLMAEYKLRTGRLTEDMSMLPLMLKKHKLRLLPTTVAGSVDRRRMWKRAKAAGGKRP